MDGKKFDASTRMQREAGIQNIYHWVNDKDIFLGFGGRRQQTVEDIFIRPAFFNKWNNYWRLTASWNAATHIPHCQTWRLSRRHVRHDLWVGIFRDVLGREGIYPTLHSCLHFVEAIRNHGGRRMRTKTTISSGRSNIVYILRMFVLRETSMRAPFNNIIFNTGCE